MGHFLAPAASRAEHRDGRRPRPEQAPTTWSKRERDFTQGRKVQGSRLRFVSENRPQRCTFAASKPCKWRLSIAICLQCRQAKWPRAGAAAAWHLQTTIARLAFNHHSLASRPAPGLGCVCTLSSPGSCEACQARKGCACCCRLHVFSNAVFLPRLQR